MQTFLRPAPGFYVNFFPNGAFPYCPKHPHAKSVVVGFVTQTCAWVDQPLCAQCGRELVVPT